MCEKEGKKNETRKYGVIFSGWQSVKKYSCVSWHSSLQIFFSLLLIPSHFFYTFIPVYSSHPQSYWQTHEGKEPEQKRKIMKCNSMKRMVRRASDIRVVRFFFHFQAKRIKDEKMEHGKKHNNTWHQHNNNLQRRSQPWALIENYGNRHLFPLMHPSTCHLSLSPTKIQEVKIKLE